jgi:hypothetical protein
MHFNDALRDGQAEAMPFCNALVDTAKERLKYLLQRIFRHATALIHDGYLDSSSAAWPDCHNDFATLWRISYGIAQDVFHASAQQLGIARNPSLKVFIKTQFAGFRLRFDTRILDDIANEFAHRDLFIHAGSHARLKPSQRKQLAHQLVHANRLALNLRQRLLYPLWLLTRETHGNLQARQGRAQFMRHVVKKSALPIHQALQALCHAVEIAPQISQFIAAAAHVSTKTHCQIALGHRLEGATQAANGLREIPRKQACEDKARGET